MQLTSEAPETTRRLGAPQKMLSAPLHSLLGGEPEGPGSGPTARVEVRGTPMSKAGVVRNPPSLRKSASNAQSHDSAALAALYVPPATPTAHSSPGRPWPRRDPALQNHSCFPLTLAVARAWASLQHPRSKHSQASRCLAGLIT